MVFNPTTPAIFSLNPDLFLLLIKYGQ